MKTDRVPRDVNFLPLFSIVSLIVIITLITSVRVIFPPLGETSYVDAIFPSFQIFSRSESSPLFSSEEMNLAILATYYVAPELTSNAAVQAASMLSFSDIFVPTTFSTRSLLSAADRTFLAALTAANELQHIISSQKDDRANEMVQPNYVTIEFETHPHRVHILLDSPVVTDTPLQTSVYRVEQLLGLHSIFIISSCGSNSSDILGAQILRRIHAPLGVARIYWPQIGPSVDRL